jgi:UDP-N-acetylglucosamine--N-acetylmuramyl-(pentapeptide) pyrophosphoryl-undecaprenol N-acetylglucosamine transferase
MPIRKDLVEAAANSLPHASISTLVFGGSQGAAAINEAVLTLVMRHGSEGTWLHLTGPKLFEGVAKTAERLVSVPSYRIKPYLDGVEMAEALSAASIAICRSGAGTVSELALFGVPAVFIPFPYAQADHQFHNAKAIEKIGGSTVMRQTEMTPQNLADAWASWAHDPNKRAQACQRLREWAYPDATERVWNVIQEVAVAP